ncbi:MAG: hypothetical protein ABIF88_01005 [archaeon]
METPIQQRIELSVTNGRGYSLFDFRDSTCFYSSFLEPSEVKNTTEGLKARLLEMNSSERIMTDGRFSYEGFIYNLNGERKDLILPKKSAWRKIVRENTRAISHAYSAEAKRRGRLRTIFTGQIPSLLEFHLFSEYMEHVEGCAKKFNA